MIANSRTVVARFIEGAEAKTAKAPVPGGRRVSSVQASTGAYYGGGDFDLYSYNTVVAIRRGKRVSLTTRKYSVTTSKLLGQVRSQLVAAGYSPTDEVIEVTAAVPGRWGGFGPAWAADPFPMVPFQVWEPVMIDQTPCASHAAIGCFDCIVGGSNPVFTGKARRREAINFAESKPAMGSPLDDPEPLPSREIGIGPVCREKGIAS